MEYYPVRNIQIWNINPSLELSKTEQYACKLSFDRFCHFGLKIDPYFENHYRSTEDTGSAIFVRTEQPALENSSPQHAR